MIKFEFCIIKNHIIPIFVDLVALEMIFIQFNEKRAVIFKIRHFEPLLAMGSIPNGQIWILHHQKPWQTHFLPFLYKYVISRSFCHSENFHPLKFRFAIPKSPFFEWRRWKSWPQIEAKSHNLQLFQLWKKKLRELQKWPSAQTPSTLVNVLVHLHK